MYSNSLSPKRTSCNLSKGWIFWLFLFCGCSEHRDLIPVGPPPNQDPEILSLEVNPLPIAIDLTAQVVAEVVDPDGDELAYLWTATAGTISGDGPGITWQAPSQKGLQTISLEVRDTFHVGISLPLQQDIRFLKASQPRPPTACLTVSLPRGRRHWGSPFHIIDHNETT